MYGLALCAGVGMLDEGVRAGFKFLGVDYRTVCFVERDAYAASTLVARMADEAVDSALVWDDLTTFNGLPWRGIVDCITGWKIALSDSKVVTAWNSVPARMRAAAKRLHHRYIEHTHAVELMLRVDGDRTVFYIDPPYPESTINFRKAIIYSTPFTDHDHFDLLSAVVNLKGKAVISGYRHPMYDDHPRDWNRLDVPHICMSGATKTECLWMNFDPERGY